MVAIYGAILVFGSAFAFWHLMPRNGVPHPLAVRRYFQVVIPVSIMVGMTLGIGLLLSGLWGFHPV